MRAAFITAPLIPPSSSFQSTNTTISSVDEEIINNLTINTIISNNFNIAGTLSFLSGPTGSTLVTLSATSSTLILAGPGGSRATLTNLSDFNQSLTTGFDAVNYDYLYGF